MDYSSFIGSQLFSVRGRLITGGGTGIGKRMAAVLTLNGAKVFITGRRFNVVQETANDLTNAAASAQSGRQCIPIEDFSANWRKQCPDLNAPVGLEEQLWSIEDSDFANMMAIHCAGPYFLAIKCIPLSKNSDNPSVCNITFWLPTSLIAPSANTHMANPKLLKYISLASWPPASSPTKLGVTLSAPLPTGTVDPDTPLWPSMQRATEEAIAARRAGKWEGIAGAVLMLASPAGAYFNEAKTDGQEIVVDGGWRLCASAKDVK
ncbi:uncharacterized protein IAS62_002876 [Cryptococcus decagattii]|uniref:NAD(P)-binding protein n=1 Tax=Cryptococcus decagattii TaxID=1859122 RepID=A0ABZ2AT54_9TREE